MNATTQENSTVASQAESGPWLDIVKRRVEGMRFGSVQIVVHEGRVTQVEATEKTRLSSHAGETGRNGNGSVGSPQSRRL